MFASEAPTCRKMACKVLTKAAASSGDLSSIAGSYQHKRRNCGGRRSRKRANVPHVGFRDNLDEGGARSVQVDEGAASVRQGRVVERLGRVLSEQGSRFRFRTFQPGGGGADERVTCSSWICSNRTGKKSPCGDGCSPCPA